MSVSILKIVQYGYMPQRYYKINKLQGYLNEPEWNFNVFTNLINTPIYPNDTQKESEW